MKNVMLIGALLASSMTFSQTSELIGKVVDDFTDKVYISANSSVFFEDSGDQRTQGMIIDQFLDLDKKGKIEVGTLYVKVAGLDTSCVEEGKLYLIFENGEKRELSSWKKFNCDGENYFKLTDAMVDILKSSPLVGIKYTNGRNFESMIVKNTLNSENSNYFINIFSEVDNINQGLVELAVVKN